ncbi:hypothetical protein LCGC14_0164940 [marine sediment metagenome]|uniref:Uncharacterized protein n=1 Tax=marine sediment metagenome TaxID=412755 RepID=A0A0F9UUY9_9ZZZZ
MSRNTQPKQGQEDPQERRHRAEQKRQWARAEYAAGQRCPGGTVTQVGAEGFYVRAPGRIIAEFVPWPNERTDADERFGRVAGPG